MKCGNDKCKWRGGDGGCRLFAGDAAGECKYRVAAAKAPAKPAPAAAKAASARTTATRKGR